MTDSNQTPSSTRPSAASTVPTAPPDPDRLEAVMGIVDAIKRARELYHEPIVEGLLDQILSGDADAICTGLEFHAEEVVLGRALEAAARTVAERKKRGVDELDTMLVCMWLGTHYIADATDAATGEWDLDQVEEVFDADVAARFAPTIHLRNLKRYEIWLAGVEATAQERQLSEHEEHYRIGLRDEINAERLLYIKSVQAVGGEIELTRGPVMSELEELERQVAELVERGRVADERAHALLERLGVLEEGLEDVIAARQTH